MYSCCGAKAKGKVQDPSFKACRDDTMSWFASNCFCFTVRGQAPSVRVLQYCILATCSRQVTGTSNSDSRAEKPRSLCFLSVLFLLVLLQMWLPSLVVIILIHYHSAASPHLGGIAVSGARGSRNSQCSLNSSSAEAAVILSIAVASATVLAAGIRMVL